MWERFIRKRNILIYVIFYQQLINTNDSYPKVTAVVLLLTVIGLA